MEWEKAPDIQKEIKRIVQYLELHHLEANRIFCFRSHGSKARARARIWSLPRIWQKALKTKPGYCIEILSEKFDHLSSENKRKILVHELLHIPQNFSGTLLPHRRNRGVSFEKKVEKMFKKLPKF